MQAVLKLTIELQYVEGGVKASSEVGTITAPRPCHIIPVGEAYQAFARRHTGGLTFEQDDANEAARIAAGASGGSDETQDKDFVEEEAESPALLKLDPRDWKKQDHYEVLGLSRLRHKATPGQINFAHRRKVLRHHPDKKAKLEGNSNDDALFKCIGKAYDQLIDPEKRRQWDSVDPGVPDDYPDEGQGDRFLDEWTPVFERESRFSKKAPVPQLGSPESTRSEVEGFYDFWYTFDSWRSFEYLDKEANEGTDSRDEKRYAERKNKAERARMKTEDNARLRNLVDAALRQDPRIRRFKQQEREARDAKKKKTQAASPAQQRAEADAQRKAEEERLKAEQAAKEADEKAQRDAAKKQREAAKKNLKRDKKAVKEAVVNANYFAAPSAAPDPALVESVLGELDRIMDALEPEEVALLRQDVDAASNAEVLRTFLVTCGDKVKERGVVLATLV